MKKIKSKFLFLFFMSAAVLSTPVVFLCQSTSERKVNNFDSKFYFTFLADQDNNEKDAKLILENFAKKINILPIRQYENANDVNFESINKDNISNYFKNLPSSNSEITVNLTKIYLNNKNENSEEINLEYEFYYSNNDSVVATYSFKKIAFVSTKKIIINFVVIPISLIFLTFILVLVIYFASKKAEITKKYNYLKSKMKK
ncbi:MAG: hypothetical protein K2I76_02465 [Malacoplasma sp.]|nr:hypothetical protein [Malacoplasma sp.]